MLQIFDLWNLLGELKLVSTNFVFAIKIKIKKNYQNWFYYTKKAPFILGT